MDWIFEDQDWQDEYNLGQDDDYYQNWFTYCLRRKRLSQIILLLVQTSCKWKHCEQVFKNRVETLIKEFREKMIEMFPKYWEGNAVIVSKLICNFLFDA